MSYCHNYITFRNSSTTWNNSDISTWIGTDSEPKAESKNIVESGGVKETFNTVSTENAVLELWENSGNTVSIHGNISGKYARLDTKSFQEAANANVAICKIEPNIVYELEYKNISTQYFGIFLSNDPTFAIVEKVMSYPQTEGNIKIQDNMYGYIAFLNLWGTEVRGALYYCEPIVDRLNTEVNDINSDITNDESIAFDKERQIFPSKNIQGYYPRYDTKSLSPLSSLSTDVYIATGRSLIRVDYVDSTQYDAVAFSETDDFAEILSVVNPGIGRGSAYIHIPSKANYIGVVKEHVNKVVNYANNVIKSKTNFSSFGTIVGYIQEGSGGITNNNPGFRSNVFGLAGVDEIDIYFKFSSDNEKNYNNISFSSDATFGNSLNIKRYISFAQYSQLNDVLRGISVPDGANYIAFNPRSLFIVGYKYIRTNEYLNGEHDEKKVVFWGDSFGARLFGYAGEIYNIFRTSHVEPISGAVGGESVPCICARQGSVIAYTTSDITLPSDRTPVEMSGGMKYVNIHGDLISWRPLATDINAETITLNPVTVDDIKCTITYQNNRYYIRRVNDSNRQHIIKAGTRILTNGLKFNTGVDATVLGLWANQGYDTADELIAYYNKAIIMSHNNVLIGYMSYGGETYNTEFYKGVELALESKFGNMLANIRKYTIGQAINDAGITLSAEDEEYIEAGNTPPVFMATDRVHFNQLGVILMIKFLYNHLINNGFVGLNNILMGFVTDGSLNIDEYYITNGKTHDEVTLALSDGTTQKISTQNYGFYLFPNVPSGMATISSSSVSKTLEINEGANVCVIELS